MFFQSCNIALVRMNCLYHSNRSARRRSAVNKRRQTSLGRHNVTYDTVGLVTVFEVKASTSVVVALVHQKC